MIWEGPLGTVAVIGIATKEAPNQCHGYVALLGSDEQSWGWNLVDNHLLHNGDSQGNYPQLNNAPKYQVERTEKVYGFIITLHDIICKTCHDSRLLGYNIIQVQISFCTGDWRQIETNWLHKISLFHFIIYTCHLQVGERIRVILDCDDNTLAFERNYEFLGVAFRGNDL